MYRFHFFVFKTTHGIVSVFTDTHSGCHFRKNVIRPDILGQAFDIRCDMAARTIGIEQGSLFFGLPWLHVSFKYRPTRRPVPARGVVAIGQFAFGFFTLSQFGIGVISISQFTVAGFAIAQFALAYSLIAQIGIYVSEGRGQIVKSVMELIELL